MTYQSNGNLVPGIHELTLEEFIKEYGYNLRRKEIIEGLKMAIEDLAACGCRTLFIDGSFVSNKRNPGDFDACWKNNDKNIDLFKMRSQYVILCNGSKERQHLYYKGELKAAYFFANWQDYYIDFFQKDKYDDSPKGIVQINIKPVEHDKE